METKEIKRQRGRPPSFNHDEALDKALQVFWSHGYEGASMAELTAAMGMNKPSIYAAFGNKEELFRQALNKYLNGPVSYIKEAMAQPTSKEAVEMLLTKSAELLCGCDSPRGCMIVQGALTVGQTGEIIKQELVSYRQGFESMLKKRFDQAKKESDLPKGADTAKLAKYVATIHQGLSVQASSGAKKKELLDVVQMVMENWPGNA
ncbi:MAG TPA: TetR/AcrR family transcriptional regulator [Methylophilaceae bacterium]|nr:TetR/AcrR family transcriptional regulator [Methylophilaceae bacterium]